MSGREAILYNQSVAGKYDGAFTDETVARMVSDFEKDYPQDFYAMTHDEGMYILANRDIELSCDEAVIRYLGESAKAAYAQALISMEETRSSFAPLCNNFSKNAMEERITAIMNYKKSSIIAIALAFALVVGITTAFATAADGTSNVPSEQSSADNNATLVLDNLNAVPPSEIGVQDKSETTIPEQ